MIARRAHHPAGQRRRPPARRGRGGNCWPTLSRRLPDVGFAARRRRTGMRGAVPAQHRRHRPALPTPSAPACPPTNFAGHRGVPVGAIGREDDPASTLGLRRADLKSRPSPVRYAGAVVAVLTHQTALASTRKSSPLERACLDCATDLAHMISRQVPNVGDLAMSRSSPASATGSSASTRTASSSSPARTRCRPTHRMGLTSELEATTSSRSPGR